MRLLATLSSAVLLLAGCGAAPRLVAPAVDYRAGVRTIEVREFSDTREPPEARSFKNPKLKTPEERAAEREAELVERARFSYALARAVARRIDAAREALDAAGIAPPLVIVRTKADPGGLLAGPTSFRAPPRDLPAPVVRIEGSVEGTTVAFSIEEPAGTQRHVLRFAPLEGYPADRGAQLVERVADHLAPSRRALESDAPLAFVRRVPEAATIEADIGLERKTFKVTEVYDLDDDAPEIRGREALERALLHRYVRIGREGAAAPPASPLRRRITVEGD